MASPDAIPISRIILSDHFAEIREHSMLLYQILRRNCKTMPVDFLETGDKGLGNKEILDIT